ncbi:MAG: thymidine phosphorylase [Pyrinomonadaceae bacterium]
MFLILITKLLSRVRRNKIIIAHPAQKSKWFLKKKLSDKVKLMRPQEIIARKRDGKTLSPAEINFFIGGVCGDGWTDYQISALLMACFINGLNTDEQTFLTRAMLDSGEVLDFSDLGAPKADKHSTGGVGDKTSLIIAPLAAACGAIVPMISGRSLGHTGGTLDKLESIENYNVKLSTAEIHRIIEKCGFALCGQTEKIVPADRKLYALRDATATVESIPLIVASIMSKKLAEGLDALVLDVKTGKGAFMKSFEDARRLAGALVKTGNNCGVKTEAVISDMNQPLGKYVGNALEVFECVKILRGEADEMMRETLELSFELAARMLVLTKIADSMQSAKNKLQNALDSGAALEKFRQNIELQNGNSQICDAPKILLDKTLLRIPLMAGGNGFITEVDALAIGESLVKIGGGRNRAEDKIDCAVGYRCVKKVGDEVRKDQTLGILFCRDENQAESLREKLRAAYRIAEEKPDKIKLVKEVIS